MKLLFVTFGLPVPPDSGARIRDFNLISRVAGRHDVSVLSLLEFPDELDRAGPLSAICNQVDGIVTGRSRFGTASAAMRSLAAGRPLATTPYYYPEMAQRIHDLTASRRFDLVQIEHSFLAPYRAALHESFNGATVLSMHNVGAQQYRSMYEMSEGAARFPAAVKSLLMQRWEAPLVNRFDHAIVVSEQDRERLLGLGVERKVSVIENGVDCQRIRPLPLPERGVDEILFVGTMGYLPNRDGVRYFCKEIFPRIRAVNAGCRLTVVGSGGREHLSDLAEPGVVEVTGRVVELAPYYQRSRVVIAPLRSGGGTRLKILEAMAYGRPVVSTSLGAEGLQVEDGSEILIADRPDRFAECVLSLVNDDGRHRSQADAARRAAESRYDWSRIAERLLELYQRIGKR